MPKVWQVRLLKGIGYFLSVVPASVTAMAYFPLWMGERKSAVSVLSVLLLFLCLLPLWRGVKSILKSPSLWQMWLILYVLLTTLEGILSGVRMVSMVAFPTGLLATVFFKWAKKVEMNDGKQP